MLFELIIVKNSSFKDDSVRDFNPHTLFDFDVNAPAAVSLY